MAPSPGARRLGRASRRAAVAVPNVACGASIQRSRPARLRLQRPPPICPVAETRIEETVGGGGVFFGRGSKTIQGTTDKNRKASIYIILCHVTTAQVSITASATVFFLTSQGNAGIFTDHSICSIRQNVSCHSLGTLRCHQLLAASSLTPPQSRPPKKGPHNKGLALNYTARRGRHSLRAL